MRFLLSLYTIRKNNNIDPKKNVCAYGFTLNKCPTKVYDTCFFLVSSSVFYIYFLLFFSSFFYRSILIFYKLQLIHLKQKKIVITMLLCINVYYYSTYSSRYIQDSLFSLFYSIKLIVLQLVVTLLHHVSKFDSNYFIVFT